MVITTQWDGKPGQQSMLATHIRHSHGNRPALNIPHRIQFLLLLRRSGSSIWGIDDSALQNAVYRGDPFHDDITTTRSQIAVIFAQQASRPKPGIRSWSSVEGKVHRVIRARSVDWLGRARR